MAADHVANCVLAHETSFDTLDVERLRTAVSNSLGIQIFTDGGFVNGTGAIAIVFTVVEAKGHSFKNTQAGVRGRLVRNAKSAFEMEVLALDWALEFLASLAMLS